jgi:hypothetical protein
MPEAVQRVTKVDVPEGQHSLAEDGVRRRALYQLPLFHGS